MSHYRKIQVLLTLIVTLLYNSHITLYDNGKASEVLSHLEWSEHAYNSYLDNCETSSKRIHQGWNYWKRNTSQHITKIMTDARDNFDIAARIEFVSRDEVNKCYHLFSFYSDRKHEDRAYYFYDVHRGKLLKFISHFLRDAANLIKKANQPNNLIQIPGYDIKDIHNPMRKYHEELNLENPRTEMPNRAFEIMLMYANGFSKQQIADILGKSKNSIMTYVLKLYKEYGFKDRIDMRKYLIAKGYNNLDAFFLGSYRIYMNGAMPSETVH